jgi:hypothetical protein
VRNKSPESYVSENIAHLKASIAVLGLLQPLLVQKIDGKFGVLAGGRRHAALLELVADKTAKGWNCRTKIDCRLVPDDCDVTTALSLAENITQARAHIRCHRAACIRRKRQQRIGIGAAWPADCHFPAQCASAHDAACGVASRNSARQRVRKPASSSIGAESAAVAPHPVSKRRLLW